MAIRAKSILAAGILLVGCEQSTTSAAAIPMFEVLAAAETEPVGTATGDAADDPAIWRNAADPAASLIVATDKKAGLYVYGIDGKRRSFTKAGLLNNVDLIESGGRVLVVASDRNDEARAKLQVYELDTGEGRLKRLGFVPGGEGEAYGVCLWSDGSALFAFSVLKSGLISQVRMDFGPRGRPAGKILRTLKMDSQGEGCVVDPQTGHLYVGEEDVGIWRFAAAAHEPANGTLVAAADGRHLDPDVEGLALAPGYLVASSQGNDSYAIYSVPDFRLLGRFRIGPGKVGSVEETDGIALALGSFGTDYPNGLFVAQDGENEPFAQNFKLVSWAEIAGSQKRSAAR